MEVSHSHPSIGEQQGRMVAGKNARVVEKAGDVREMLLAIGD